MSLTWTCAGDCVGEKLPSSAGIVLLISTVTYIARQFAVCTCITSKVVQLYIRFCVSGKHMDKQLHDR